MNNITLAGHLGADPEVRFTSSGQKVTTLRVAAKSRSGGKDGAIWWRVTVWGDQFDKMMQYFKKGSSIIVTGEVNKLEVFTAKDGNSQVSANVTAYNLMFSPFGRASGGEGGEGFLRGDNEDKREMSEDGVGVAVGRGKEFSQGNDGSSFGDEDFSGEGSDEIPF